MPKIKSIKIDKVDLKLSRPYAIAFKTIEHVENAIVTIELDNGVIGRGAGNPSEQVVGENLDHTLRALELSQGANKEQSWRGLIDRDIDDILDLTGEVQKNLAHSPTARTALEIALYDCFAQRKNIPLVKLMGQEFESMPTSITIGIKGVSATLEEASEYLEKGFSYLKIKLGNDLMEDVERIIKLREKFRDRIHIRVDANQGYDSKELEYFCSHTASANLELIEQPLPAGQVEGMRCLSSEIRKILAADESLLGPDDAQKLIGEDPACGIFNIKLMKCGGISQAKEISRLAQARDIELMWGCNDESIISIAAALHTALSCRNTRYLDLDGSLDLAADVVSGGFVLQDGVMKTNGLPGLGLMDL